MSNLSTGIVGGLLGAATGAYSAGEGNRLKGALIGGGLGAGAGLGARGLYYGLSKSSPGLTAFNRLYDDEYKLLEAAFKNKNISLEEFHRLREAGTTRKVDAMNALSSKDQAAFFGSHLGGPALALGLGYAGGSAMNKPKADEQGVRR